MFYRAFVSILKRVSLQDLFCTHPCSVCIVLFLPGFAHADILKPACTLDCIGQVNSSVDSVGMNYVQGL